MIGANKLGEPVKDNEQPVPLYLSRLRLNNAVVDTAHPAAGYGDDAVAGRGKPGVDAHDNPPCGCSLFRHRNIRLRIRAPVSALLRMRGALHLNGVPRRCEPFDYNRSAISTLRAAAVL